MSTNPLPKLFCNCDGVLTSARTYYLDKQPRLDTLDPVALGMLEKFCKDLNVEVIMASAWVTHKNANDWRETFSARGFTIPVVDRLDYRDTNHGDWATLMHEYMDMRAAASGVKCEYVLFEDDPVDPEDPNLVVVDARVGLTLDNLRAAAQVLRPGSPVIHELEQLSRSFSTDKTITVGIQGGPSVSVHPRDIGKALDQLGIPPAPAAQ